MTDEKDVSAQQGQTQPEIWFSCADENSGREAGFEAPQGQRPAKAYGF
jgi:hypothetical protein